ncbi:PR domain zinc finger protein 10 [Homalodisca vitripennis]|nr:PR domain zinc finger protein 10 [Homalodisca vitripennis]
MVLSTYSENYRSSNMTKLVNASDYERYIYKCHSCMLGFKRRGMLVNHLANRHPDITPESVPELNLPILKTTRDYYCQYCEKIYKSSSKRKAHILKNHPGLELPMSNRQKGGVPDIPGLPNPTFSQTVGSITTTPHGCQWCHKQYASKAKLLQHQRKKHVTLMPHTEQTPRPLKNLAPEENIEKSMKPETKPRASKYNDIVGPIPIALSTNLNQVTLTSSNLNHFQEYEIIDGEDDTAENGILIDSQSIIKRESLKNDNIPSDLLSQAMSEIGATLSDLRAISSDQYFKLLQDPIYTPYTAR